MTVKHQVSIISAVCGVLISANAVGHGWVFSPESRGYFCQQGINSNCGEVEYEPQSIEGPDGFPELGPADGKIPSAGISRFSELNIQTSDRWAKSNISAGPMDISWEFTMNHVTRNFRYYITKPDWNANTPLTRAELELTPFCTIDGGMIQPPIKVTHNCNVPERSGYHVILAVWEVGDTAASFYNVLDVNFENSDIPDSPWAQGGTIYPSKDLQVGDKVKTRVFDESGEVAALTTQVKINTPEQGLGNQWAYALAKKINKKQTDYKAGQITEEGKFNPVYGQNPIYLKKGSGLTRVEIEIEQQNPIVPEDFTVMGIESEYVLDNGSVTLDFTVSVEGEMTITNTVYDHGGASHAQTQADIQDSTVAFSMPLQEMTVGHHTLVVKGISKTTGEHLQKSYDFMITQSGAGGDYEFTFPNSVESYTEGTRVLQPKDGKIYQCKVFPYSGYCKQWTENATQFEPGTGSDWQVAWEQVQ